MNRHTLQITMFSMIVVATAVFGACTWPRADPGADTEAEYIRNRYGIIVHYTFGCGGGQRYPGTCNVDGSIPESLDEVADNFDAEGFARDMVAFGVEYVIFTPYHASMNTLYPSKEMDNWRPGHTAKRDVIRDLINALKGTGIKLYLYGHVNDGRDFSPEDRVATGFTDPPRARSGMTS